MPQLDPDRLRAALTRVHEAGIPGVFAEVRADEQIWRSAAGVADVDSAEPATVDMRHRVGSIAKTFLATAVFQRIEAGEFELEDPIGRYLPRLVPGARGDAITIRMLLNHTSGLAEYLPQAYPSLKAFPVLADTRPESLEEHRFTRFSPVELIELGVAAPPVGEPGGTPGIYSNTNSLLLCQLIEHLTGFGARQYITERVIEPAELSGTELPTEPHIEGPHSRIYESWFGLLEPPGEYSVYDMSWVGPAASLISTVADLNRFFAALLGGEILNQASLASMRETVPVISLEGKPIDYGLGLHRQELPGRGVFWGHDGSVWGAGAITMTSADGRNQMSVAVNRQRWNRLNADGKPMPHPIDAALADLYRLAMFPEELERR